MTKQDYHKQYYLAHREKILQRSKARQEQHKHERQQYCKQYYIEHSEEIKDNRIDRHQNKRDFENQQMRVWRRNNRKVMLHHSTAYRKHIKQATPPWADLQAIKRFYENCPDGYHVDHVVPLRGKAVNGLHVLGNLQYLLAIDNLRKNNSFVNN